jgi:hypothetical protein
MTQDVFRPKSVKALVRRKFSFSHGGKKVEKTDKINLLSCIVNIRKIIGSITRRRGGGVGPITKQRNRLNMSVSENRFWRKKPILIK